MAELPGYASRRDRLFTRRTAAAMTSPAAVLVTGAGAAITLGVGAPLWAVAAAGVAGWAAVVAIMMPRTRTRVRVDADALAEPWRSHVREAEQAAERFARALSTVADGPVRERMERIGARVDDAVAECWLIAQRGAALDHARAHLVSPDALREQLSRLPAHGGGAAQSTRESLQAQLDVVERIDRTKQEVNERLLVLDARLDETVARAVEIGLATDQLDADTAGRLDAGVEAVVADMEALRVALEEVSQPASGVTLPPPPPTRPAADPMRRSQR